MKFIDIKRNCDETFKALVEISNTTLQQNGLPLPTDDAVQTWRRTVSIAIIVLGMIYNIEASHLSMKYKISNFIIYRPSMCSWTTC